MIRTTAAAVIAALTVAAPVLGNYTMTQGVRAPTYSTLLTFDEPGGPTGSGIASNAFASYGISSFISADGNLVVGDNTGGGTQPWVGEGTNSAFGNFGLQMQFDTDLTEISFQQWDTSGPSGPFGGGIAIFLFDDGVQVAAEAFTPAWGGIGDEWFNITTSDGMVFDQVIVNSNGTPAFGYMDNISWNVVPAPGSLALLAAAGLFGRRRRRA